ncbi:hypothetical protein SCLCIDRAFT_376293 [Scleroderma citrinum Foug A]|uniref:Uncharacterized protein n=1 Tax=Scleroderma citrinum Foug A TaxID=1036808 RepID=A0A0C2ZPC4_9AGAM|nr:hypothetical protein SCLCIDRAFT_376293 [Scleroderma citrinum Foug A]
MDMITRNQQCTLSSSPTVLSRAVPKRSRRVVCYFKRVHHTLRLPMLGRIQMHGTLSQTKHIMQGFPNVEIYNLVRVARLYEALYNFHLPMLYLASHSFVLFLD